MRVETYTSPYKNAKCTNSKIDAVYAVKVNKTETVQGAKSENQKKNNFDSYSGSVTIDLDKSSEAMKDEKKRLAVMTVCMKISKRLIMGDNVPVADKNYLRKNDPSLYARSIIKRFPKNNPYKYKRISPYEKQECDSSGVIAGVLTDFAKASETDMFLQSIDSQETKKL